MRMITLPAIDSTGPRMVTLFLSDYNNLAVLDGLPSSSYDKGTPTTCYLISGGKSTGGWHIAMTRNELVKELEEIFV
jgi:hypothetical protein